VFAIATPTEDGYLSVRLKPTSGLLAAIKREYPSHRAIEQRDKCTPADSARLLVARLAELGFRDYAHFMATALSGEIDARNQQMGRPPDRIIRIFRDLVESAGSLMQQAGSFRRNTKRTSTSRAICRSWRRILSSRAPPSTRSPTITN